MNGDSLGGTPGNACRLIVRKKPGPAELLQFVVGGVVIGQQLVVVAVIFGHSQPSFDLPASPIVSRANGTQFNLPKRHGRLGMLLAEES